MEASRVDTDLPGKMANLDLMEIESTQETSENQPSSTSTSSTSTAGYTPRVLRKRKSIAPEVCKSNRRVNMKPRKHTVSETANIKQIEALYLNKKVKPVCQTLETIFEETKTENNDSEILIGGRKIKRMLTFPISNQYTKDKIKKRRSRIKKVFGNTSFLNRKKIPMPLFMKTIECLETDDPVLNESTSTGPT